MSNGSSSGIALGGLVFATVFGIVAFAAISWFGASYYYGQQRNEVRNRVLATAEWSPTRVERSFGTDCKSGQMREEAELALEDVGRFDLGKVFRFKEAPTNQRARELARTIKEMKPATDAFLAAADCQANTRLVRDGTEQQTSGVVLARGVLVDSWNHAEKVDALQTVAWVGRDIQSTDGLYEFKEGSLVLESAYIALGHALANGYADGQLDDLRSQLTTLVANEDSAQLHWRAGARILLADILGKDWDETPPTPLRARAMLASMDEVIQSLESMPDVASQPYPERHKVMKEWIAKHDMSTWDVKFRGFGKAGLQVDGIATRTHAYGRALLIATALRQFKKQRGYCPRELAELTERGFLTDEPMDPIGNAPFTYDRETCRVTSAEPLLKGKPVTVSATEYP